MSEREPDPRRRLWLRGRFREAARDELDAQPRPPWALTPDADFLERCTRCADCLRACPEHILKAGDGGWPVIDFGARGCTLCGACRSACPTAALGREPGREAFPWKVSLAPSCLAFRHVECRLCGDACGEAALRFVPAPGGISQPRVDAACCTGCGDCVAPCPVGAVTLLRPEPG